MAQSLEQINKPLTVSAGLDANQPCTSQFPVKLFCLSVSVDQLVLGYFPSLAVENRNLLPSRMEITPYNNHGLGPSTKEHTGSLEPSLLSNQFWVTPEVQSPSRWTH